MLSLWIEVIHIMFECLECEQFWDRTFCIETRDTMTLHVNRVDTVHLNQYDNHIQYVQREFVEG